MQIFNELPRQIVGDGQRPNVYLVTHQRTGAVWAAFPGDGTEDNAERMQAAAIAFADSFTEPLMVEDRLTGVVHDNPAGERYQDECREAEETIGTVGVADTSHDLAEWDQENPYP